jgi:CheY-like chemotaxis protein
MRVLVVDDDKVRHDFFDKAYAECEVVHAYGYYEATDALDRGAKFDIIQLDHDLGDHRKPDTLTEMYGTYELNGYHIAVYLVMDLPFDKRPGKVIVHSINPGGAHGIEMFLERHGFDVIRRPFVYQD